MNPLATLIIGWALALGILGGLLAAMVMAFLAGHNFAGTMLGFAAILLVGWAGSEIR